MNQPTGELACLLDEIDAHEIYEPDGSTADAMCEIDALLDAFFQEATP